LKHGLQYIVPLIMATLVRTTRLLHLRDEKTE
jgi:hypothetical protein